MVWEPMLVSALFAVGRNVVGWAESSLANGKIEDYEWKQLGSTVLRMTVFGIAAFYGLDAVVGNISPVEAGAITTLIDYIRGWVKKSAPVSTPA